MGKHYKCGGNAWDSVPCRDECQGPVATLSNSVMKYRGYQLSQMLAQQSRKRNILIRGSRPES